MSLIKISESSRPQYNLKRFGGYGLELLLFDDTRAAAGKHNDS
jgi:hypothetical protein